MCILVCKAEGLIQGLGPSNNKQAVVNLLNANDSLLFGHCDVKQVAVMKWILYMFKLFSRYTSTCETFLPLVFSSWRTSHLNILVFLCGRDRWGNQTVCPLSKESKRNLMIGEENYSPRRGRITLLNTVLSSSLLYFLSFFHLPKWV